MVEVKKPTESLIKTIAVCLVLVFFVFSFSVNVFSGHINNDAIIPDTILLKKGYTIRYNNTILNPAHDTVLILNDTTSYQILKNPSDKSKAFYNSLFEKSRTSFFWRHIYEWLMRYQPSAGVDDPEAVETSASYEKYSGRLINKIVIKQKGLFTGSMEDTSKIFDTDFNRFINRLHIETSRKVLKKNLLFNKGEELKPVILADNERLLRNLPGVENARIIVYPDKSDTAKVNVYIITRDAFPWSLNGGVKNWNKYSVKIENANILGTDLKISNKSLIDLDHEPVYGNDFMFNANNISGSFINSSFRYFEYSPERIIKLSFSRPFYSTVLKYGGAAGIEFQKGKHQIGNSVNDEPLYEKSIQQIWLGRSFLIGNIDERQNLTLAALLNRHHFNLRPDCFSDSCLFFKNHSRILISLKYSKLRYYKTGLLKSFGKTEDIPTGFLAGITAGALRSEFLNRPYLGAEVTYGKFNNTIGYYSGRIAFGGLIDQQRFSQAGFKFVLSWFSPLFNEGYYRYRHFLNVSYYSLTSRDIKRTTGFDNDIPGLDGEQIEGNSTLEINYEGVVFSPWNLIGFRFAPFVHTDIGILGNTSDLFSSNKVYYSVGMGVRIRNEHLAYNTIIIRLSYIPRDITGGSTWEFGLDNNIERMYYYLNTRRPDDVNNIINDIFR